VNLEKKYPKLFDKLEDKDVELRHLLSVDENYEDYDSEEFEYDFEDYNYIIYIAEPIQNILGREKLEEFMVKLHDNSDFENFLASEIDLYAIKSHHAQDRVEEIVLEQIEAVL
jgi:hypothetical protein